MTFYLKKDSRGGKILHFLYVYEHQKRCTSSFLFFRDSRRATERVAACQLWHKRPLLYAVIGPIYFAFKKKPSYSKEHVPWKTNTVSEKKSKVILLR